MSLNPKGITYFPLRVSPIKMAHCLPGFSTPKLSLATLDIDFCIRALGKALSITTPNIFNSDQGSQFTSVTFLECLEQRSIHISMDGRERAKDNVFTERLWCSVKYEEVYLNDYTTVSEAKQGIGNYIAFYNQERPHQSLNYKTPTEMYFDSNNQKKKLDCILNMANSCLDNGVHLMFLRIMHCWSLLFSLLFIFQIFLLLFKKCKLSLYIINLIFFQSQSILLFNTPLI